MVSHDASQDAQQTKHASPEVNSSRVPGVATGLAGRALALQRSAGNQAVQRMLRRSPASQGARRPSVSRGVGGGTIQRYPVGVAADADYDTLLDWLMTSSPHLPDAWALTTANFSYNTGRARAELVEEGEYTVTFRGPRVTLSKEVDMPTWRSSSREMRVVWDAMYSELRAHEARHEGIADRWKTELQRRMNEYSVTVYADSETEAKEQAVADFEFEFAGWIDEQQAEQDAIDPFTATLARPAGEDEGEAEGETAIGNPVHPD
jgi:hypothetical protein